MNFNFVFFIKKSRFVCNYFLETTHFHNFEEIAHFIKICVSDKNNNNQLGVITIRTI
uniref:Uncharacterized protein n=1 Tax=Heterorhabditis bacteriophora TaxID=37862 RepID=A0A1I7W6Q3_HETBA